jgi:DNA invertase Pin-like site-specific DNA recombinase
MLPIEPLRSTQRCRGDRLGRSLKHLIDTIPRLHAGGIGFKSVTEQIDTTTPGGKLIFHLFAALAEFERDIIRERTQAGLSAARARGRQGGRPRLPGNARKIALAPKNSTVRARPW